MDKNLEKILSEVVTEIGSLKELVITTPEQKEKYDLIKKRKMEELELSKIKKE